MRRWKVGASGIGVGRSRRRGLTSFVALALLTSFALGACAGTAHGAPTTSAPATIALPPQLAGYHIFVSDLVTGDVAELGVHTYHTSPSVHGLGLSHDGRWLFATDVAGNQLVAYPMSGATLGTPHRVTTGIQPVHMVNTPDGRRVFVTNFSGSSVSVIDTATWTVERTIPTPTAPHGVAISPDGRWVYAACYAAGKVVVIDTQSEIVAATISLPVGSHPYGVALDTDGHYLYITDNLTGRLYVLDTAARAIIADAQVGLSPALIARSPDGRTLYVANGKSHNVSVVDISQPASPVVRHTINVSGYPHGLAVTPDGRYVVVAETFGKDVAVIDTTTDTVIANIQGMTYPNDVLIP